MQIKEAICQYINFYGLLAHSPRPLFRSVCYCYTNPKKRDFSFENVSFLEIEFQKITNHFNKIIIKKNLSAVEKIDYFSTTTKKKLRKNTQS